MRRLDRQDRRRVRGTQRRRLGPRAPALARPSVPAPRQPPRRAPPPRGHDATLGGPDRDLDRSHRPARDAPPAGRSRWPHGRRPSAPADDGNAPAHRARSAPQLRRALPRRARSRAARPRATTRSRRRSARPPPQGGAVGSQPGAVEAGGGSSARSGSSAATRREARIRPPAPPRVSPRGNSSNASGLPRVSATIRSRTRSSKRPAIAESSSARASPSLRPPTTCSGSPANSCSSLAARTANTNPTRSASRRRATNASVCAETRSSHCASSTRQTSGCFLGHLSQQAEHRQPDEEAVRRLPRRSDQTPCQAHRAAVPAAGPSGPASAHTAAATRRTRAPSRTQPPPPAQRDILPRAPTGTPTTRSSRTPPRRARPALDSDPPAQPPAADQASRTRRHDRPAQLTRAGAGKESSKCQHRPRLHAASTAARRELVARRRRSRRHRSRLNARESQAPVWHGTRPRALSPNAYAAWRGVDYRLADLRDAARPPTQRRPRQTSRRKTSRTHTRTSMNAGADSSLTLRWRDRSFVLRAPEEVEELARRLRQKGLANIAAAISGAVVEGKRALGKFSAIRNVRHSAQC